MKHTALLMAAGLMLLASCGRSDAVAAGVASLEGAEQVAAPADVSTDADVDTEAAMLAMAECMREHGVEMADPEVDSDGNVLPPRPVDPENVERRTIQAAREACSELLDGIEFGFESIDQTELQDTLLEYATCMRDNGYDMPDPDLSAVAGPGQGPGGGPFGELDRTDPDFISAQEACADVLGEFGRGAGPSRGSGPGGGA